MVTSLLDSAKRVLTKSSSTYTSNHPPRNDKSCGVLEDRHQAFPKEKNSTSVWKNGGAIPQDKDVSRTHNLQPTHEPIRLLPRKETTPPKSTQEPDCRARQNSMHEFRALIKEQKGSQLLAMQDTVQDSCEAHINEIRRLTKEIQRLDSVVISRGLEQKEAGNKICELEKKIRLRDEDIRNLQQRLRISEEQRSQTMKLLDDRTAELKGAQTFLTTADRYSGADIIKMAESLNAEIFQVSAQMAEFLVDVPVAEDSVVQERQYTRKYKDHLDDGRKIIGSRLFDHLVTKSSEIRADPFPLQLGFQALFTWWCVYEVDRFCEGPTGKGLKQIYRRIYESEIQAVAGRWRVMTSVQTMNPNAPSHADFVFWVILGLMHICGWSKADTSQREMLSIQQAVSRIERMWKTLKAAIMQEIAAAEITIAHVSAGCDYNTAKMVDMYVDTKSDVTTNLDNCGQPILCTIGVGLQRDVSKRSENGTMKIYREVILKPKVALASVLLNGESPNAQTDTVLSATDGKK